MMIDAEVPIEMRYERIIPKGFPCIYKEWDLAPVTGNKNWVASDVIRFNFANNSTGVLDRLRSYIQITVSTNIEDCPIGLLQIDNSAQSFIQTMVLYSNNAQIERIHQYGALAAYLNDTGMNQFITQGRQQEGFGYGSFDTMPYGKASGSGTMDVLKNSLYGSYRSNGLIKPTIPNVFLYDEQIVGSRYGPAKVLRKVVSGLNPYLFPNTMSGGQFDANKTIAHKSVSQHGYYMNMRGQYLANFMKTNTIQTTSSIPCYQLDLDQSVFTQGGYSPSSFVSPQNVDGNIVYQTTVPSQLNQVLFSGNTAGTMRAHKLTTANYGFANLFSPAFSRGTFEPIISPTVRQIMLKQGVILDTKQPLSARKFQIPLLSSVIGILAQQTQFSLIPLNALNGCLLELTLDPYAMFTSGYKDISQGDLNGMTYQQKRSYYIENIQYKLHTYHYVDSQIVTYIQNSLYKQINLTTNFWILAGQYKVAANTGPQNSYSVSCRVKNLNQLVSLFVSTDYLKYSFCRKHYRLSNNVTQFYCKIGADYLPPNPHRGNGGNPASQAQYDDNSVFIKNIYYSNGYMFSQTPLPRINPYNFAINQRPYDVHNRQAHYAPQMVNSGSSYVFGGNSVNADTAMGYAWIHENRCVGKAAYVLNFSPFTKQSTILKGLNVSGVQDFYVCFETSGNNVYTNDQLHLIFARVSGMVRYGQSRIQTFGR